MGFSAIKWRNVGNLKQIFEFNVFWYTHVRDIFVQGPFMFCGKSTSHVFLLSSERLAKPTNEQFSPACNNFRLENFLVGTCVLCATALSTYSHFNVCFVLRIRVGCVCHVCVWAEHAILWKVCGLSSIVKTEITN